MNSKSKCNALSTKCFSDLWANKRSEEEAFLKTTIY